MIDINEVIKLTGLCKATVYNRIARGTFPDSRLVEGRAVWDAKEIKPYLERKRLVIEIDKPTGLALDDFARLFGLPISETITDLVIGGIKSMSIDPFYKIDWVAIERVIELATLKDYLELYSDFMRAIDDNNQYRFDVRIGDGEDAVLLKAQKIVPKIKRSMESHIYHVTKIYRIDD